MISLNVTIFRTTTNHLLNVFRSAFSLGIFLVVPICIADSEPLADSEKTVPVAESVKPTKPKKAKKEPPFSNTQEARLPFLCSSDDSLVSNVIAGSETNTKEHAELFLKNSVILGRPTDKSISISILPYAKFSSLAVHYGTATDALDQVHEAKSVDKCRPLVIEVDNLKSNQQYYYRVVYEDENGQQVTEVARFHTARAPGATFSFAVHADPHLGSLYRFAVPQIGIEPQNENASEEMYAVTMANTLAAEVDFMIDLGDTFMTEKNMSRGLYESQFTAVEPSEDPRREPMIRREVMGDYVYIRNQFAQAAHSVPLFLSVGNHEAEVERLIGKSLDESPAAWANEARKSYFPTPTACEHHSSFDNQGFYSGQTKADANVTEVQGTRCHDSYYAWHWGDALFIVLDPMWNFTGDRSPWGRTLGKDQYDWLKATLESSSAPFKFVFTHYLVGGFDNKFGSSRGGALMANYYEWGGCTEPWSVNKWSERIHPQDYDILGKCEQEFEEHRKGWGGDSIQTLLLENGVQIVFHGHDHLFVYEQHPNGLVYQEVPKPTDVRDTVARATSRAKNYNYDTQNVTGVKTVIDSNSGFLYVTVNAPASDEASETDKRSTTVEYRKSTQDLTCLTGAQNCYTVNESVKTSYSVSAQ
jgi:hypothetical protein